MNQEIYQLFRRYQQSKCGREDALWVLDLVERGHFDAEWNAALEADETEVLELDGPVTGMTEAESEHLHRRILRSVAKERTRRLSWIRYAAAAMLLIGLAYAGYYWNAQPDEHMADVQTIVPGGNRAVLTLGDGQTLELSENQEEIVVNDQQLIYADGSEVVDLQAVAANEQRSTLLTVTTPKGGTYRVTLPDGSRVWLNAGSTLTYPSQFDETERMVQLTGEAFFEIKEQRSKEQGQANTAGDLRAFKVVTRDQTVEVLGTQFNISAYSDEPEIKTTLIEGSVKISNLISHATYMLVPNEQAVIRGLAMDIRAVDVSSQIAWKNGFFDFNALTLDEAMRQIARWYDIDVVYENGIPEDVVLGGKMERNLSFETALEILERLNLRYRLEPERKLVVLNP